MKTITRYFRRKFGNDPERQCCEITCDVCGSKTTALAGIDAIRMVNPVSNASTPMDGEKRMSYIILNSSNNNELHPTIHPEQHPVSKKTD